MDRLNDLDDPITMVVLPTVVFVFVSFITLAGTPPLVAGLLVAGLVFLGAAASESIGSEASEADQEATSEREPLVMLKERYARGELSEEEFEHRVTKLLDVDEIAESNSEAEPIAERE
jgi:hypothetical protein